MTKQWQIWRWARYVGFTYRSPSKPISVIAIVRVNVPRNNSSTASSDYYQRVSITRMYCANVPLVIEVLSSWQTLVLILTVICRNKKKMSFRIIKDYEIILTIILIIKIHEKQTVVVDALGCLLKVIFFFKFGAFTLPTGNFKEEH